MNGEKDDEESGTQALIDQILEKDSSVLVWLHKRLDYNLQRTGKYVNSQLVIGVINKHGQNKLERNHFGKQKELVNVGVSPVFESQKHKH